ncbi:hypothetical protein SFPB_035 [Shigella phage SFPB]|uniref:Uncharacterized protein n=4 Tax=Mooglevirus TaxID=1985303 RepID=A0AAE9VV84_9CAUD|nr:hypothetical protein SFPB_035 [Shigella phage SFPB]
MGRIVSHTPQFLMGDINMQVLVNFIYKYENIFSTMTVAQRNPVIPREGETVEINDWNYRVEEVKHKLKDGYDHQVVNVYLKGKWQ